MQLRSELQTRILGPFSGEIRHHFFQVTSHALLFHLHVIFFNFHGQNRFLGHSKIVALAHAKIKDFSTYRASYTRKNGPNPRTYTAVLQTVAYVAVHMIF